jgi:hypothetical protein
MRNPGTDFHRRAADDREANAIIARDAQKERNALEWFARGDRAYANGETELGDNLHRQARLETRRLYDGRKN